MGALEEIALEAYDRTIGLKLTDVSRWTAASQRLRRAARRRAEAR